MWHLDPKIFHLLSLFICARCFNPFDDGQYDINWGGPVTLREGQVTPNGEDFLSSRESVVMITKDNERYKCILPQDDLPREKRFLFDGPDPEVLLKSLVARGECSYRLDTYWTYELCHGRHIKQFHELKAGVVDAKAQEYHLGKLEPKPLDEKPPAEPQPLDAPPSDETDSNKKVPTRKINGHIFPYYKVTMGNGTPCDLLGNKPRTTSILYMCAPRSSNEIVSVKEVQTCQYEVEVFTPLICANPAYSYREKPVHLISCHPLEGSPDEPRSYSELMDEKFGLEGFVSREYTEEDPSTPPAPSDEHRDIPPQPDLLLSSAFLRGEYCLVGGGSSWWKYELCYGRHVTQFHEEENGPRTNILLGKWVKEAHISWKKDKWSDKTGYTDHFYSGGDTCGLTGKPRTVQVRLKCKESSHLQEFALSLTEPSTCEYVLRVESPIICPLLDKMDEHGLFEMD
ncbi:Endoplasmic reticulum lectin 1 [Desmophyllum pertusum]|uniref:Endoplasmic reticulum lectin 1 n=1 Tax=Desmophyllum pertusum TaxID=174260 RepID=A0A9X0CEG0_9CNID|nr:Endoplasmic reticulum lectin 1 [Desmophyllum pertusum]